MKTLKLNEKANIPVLGFGTWQLVGDKGVEAVAKALQVGYRHIDTAQGYGNHREIAQAIQQRAPGSRQYSARLTQGAQDVASGGSLPNRSEARAC